MTDVRLSPPTLGARIRKSVDWVVLTLALGIVVLAMINLKSAGGDDWAKPPVSDQMLFVGAGCFAMALVAALDYRIFYRLAYIMYGTGVALVGAVLVMGTTINNATRWLDLGILPRFQPSELMKLMIVFGLARFLHDIADKGDRRWRRLWIPALMIVVPAALIVRQPDLSTGIILVLIGVVMLVMTELSFKVLLGAAVAGVASFVVAWRFLMEDYQRERVNV